MHGYPSVHLYIFPKILDFLIKFSMQLNVSHSQYKNAQKVPSHHLNIGIVIIALQIKSDKPCDSAVMWKLLMGLDFSL